MIAVPIPYDVSGLGGGILDFRGFFPMFDRRRSGATFLVKWMEPMMFVDLSMSEDGARRVMFRAAYPLAGPTAVSGLPEACASRPLRANRPGSHDFMAVGRDPPNEHPTGSNAVPHWRISDW